MVNVIQTPRVSASEVPCHQALALMFQLSMTYTSIAGRCRESLWMLLVKGLSQFVFDYTGQVGSQQIGKPPHVISLDLKARFLRCCSISRCDSIP
jgi:hypothetical protein